MILSNTIYQIIGKIFTAGAGLIVTSLISRYLGISSLGEYAIMMSFIAPFYLFFDLGLNPIIVGKSVRGEFDLQKELGGIYLLRLKISLLAIVIGFCILYLTPYSFSVKYACAIALFTILFQALSNTSLIFFQAKLLFKYSALAQCFGSLSLVVFVFIAVSMQMSLWVIAAGFLLSTLIIFTVGIVFVAKYKIALLGFSRRDNLLILKESLPLAVAVGLSGLNAGADKFLLSLYLPKEQNGYYFLAYKIFEMALAIPFFLMQSLYPALAKMAANNKLALTNLVKRAIGYLCLFSCSFFILTCVFGKTALTTFWGPSAINSYSSLVILSVGMIVFSITGPLSWGIIALKQEKSLPKIYLVALIFNILTNLVLIPKFGFITCAYTTILTEFIILLLLFLEFKNLKLIIKN